LFFGNTLPQPTVVARWKDDNMDNTTLIIIIIIVVLLIGGGGWYGRGRWY